MHKGKREMNNATQTHWERQGTGLPVKAGRGARGRKGDGGRRGRETWKGEPLGGDRDLGAGRCRQRGDERTRGMATTGMQNGNIGSRRELGSRLRTAREVSAWASVGGLQVGATSRRTDDLR